MKNIIAGLTVVMCGVNIFSGSSAYNEAHPIVYARAAEIPEPKEVLVEARVDWTPERINLEIENKAQEYGVSASEMKRVIKCESNGSTTIQSYHTKNGVREESYGLVQIHLPSHKHITKEQATEPAFAIDFMAQQFAAGNQRLWSCY